MFEAGGPSSKVAEGKAKVGARAAVFEQAAVESKPHEVEKKKTWTKGPGGSYQAHTKIGDGPAGKRRLSQLP